jgi:CRP-like cAMP-binding protein
MFENNWWGTCFLPQGLDTPGRFTALNNSLQQRTMIARALLQNTPVLLLDEPFAFLDASSKTQMSRSMTTWTFSAPRLPGDLAEGPEELPLTVLIATKDHGVASVCDEVVFLQDGRVVEQGSQADLMKRRGAYFRFKQRGDLVFTIDSDTAGVQPTLLAELWPLAELSLDALEELAELFLTQKVAQGDVLFKQGDNAANMYIVVEGIVENHFKLHHPTTAGAMSKKGESNIDSAAPRPSLGPSGLLESEDAEMEPAVLLQGERVSTQSSSDVLGVNALTPPAVLSGGTEPTHEVSCVAMIDCTVLVLPRATFLGWLAERNATDGARYSVEHQVLWRALTPLARGRELHLHHSVLCRWHRMVLRLSSCAGGVAAGRPQPV